jgi:hypothetical protein
LITLMLDEEHELWGFSLFDFLRCLLGCGHASRIGYDQLVSIILLQSCVQHYVLESLLKVIHYKI